jgi:hypothetical protein
MKPCKRFVALTKATAAQHRVAVAKLYAEGLRVQPGALVNRRNGATWKHGLVVRRAAR